MDVIVKIKVIYESDHNLVKTVALRQTVQADKIQTRRLRSFRYELRLAKKMKNEPVATPDGMYNTVRVLSVSHPL